MKKLALILGSLLVIGAVSQAKEVRYIPKEKEVIPVLEVVEEPIVRVTQKNNNVYIKGSIGKIVGYPTLDSKVFPFSIKNFDGITATNYIDNIKSMTYKKDESIGFGAYLEYTRNLIPEFELGLGAGYVKHGKVIDSMRYTNISSYFEDFDMPNITSIPIYLAAKYNFDIESEFRPYIKTNLGYSYNSTKDEVNKMNSAGKLTTKNTKVGNGLYYGVSGGLEYNDFIIELAWNRNNYSIDFDAKRPPGKPGIFCYSKKDYNFSTVSLNVGYRFNF